MNFSYCFTEILLSFGFRNPKITSIIQYFYRLECFDNLFIFLIFIFWLGTFCTRDDAIFVADEFDFKVLR